MERSWPFSAHLKQLSHAGKMCSVTMWSCGTEQDFFFFRSSNDQTCSCPVAVVLLTHPPMIAHQRIVIFYCIKEPNRIEWPALSGGRRPFKVGKWVDCSDLSIHLLYLFIQFRVTVCWSRSEYTWDKLPVRIGANGDAPSTTLTPLFYLEQECQTHFTSGTTYSLISSWVGQTGKIEP